MLRFFIAAIVSVSFVAVGQAQEEGRLSAVELAAIKNLGKPSAHAKEVDPAPVEQKFTKTDVGIMALANGVSVVKNHNIPDVVILASVKGLAGAFKGKKDPASVEIIRVDVEDGSFVESDALYDDMPTVSYGKVVMTPFVGHHDYATKEGKSCYFVIRKLSKK